MAKSRRPKLEKPTSDEKRVASSRKRNPIRSLRVKGRLKNQDPTLLQYSPRDGIALYDRIPHQFPGVFGHCTAWIDHVLVNEIVIKSAKATTPEEQDLATEAAERASLAWARVRNKETVARKILWGRFYGFSRAEKVWRFDTVLEEWVQDLYDVAQRFWEFDEDGNEFLVSPTDWRGEQVDPDRFAHFQWGSADTKYGEGDFAKVYSALYTIQQLEAIALDRIEDNESKIHIRVPEGFEAPEADATRESFEAHFGVVITTPYPGEKVEVDDNNAAIIASGVTARPELEQINWLYTQVQTALLGAPQTGHKQLGTGKVEETRAAVWDDKTPLGLAVYDSCMTTAWLDTYYDMNMPSLPLHLRARFDSTTTDIQAGLSGAAATEMRNFALDLIAKRITLSIAVEGWVGLGIPRPRAQAMGESAVKERDALALSAAESTKPEKSAETAVSQEPS